MQVFAKMYLDMKFTPEEFRIVTKALAGLLTPDEEELAFDLNKKMLKSKAQHLRDQLKTTEGALKKAEVADGYGVATAAVKYWEGECFRCGEKLTWDKKPNLEGHRCSSCNHDKLKLRRVSDVEKLTEEIDY